MNKKLRLHDIRKDDSAQPRAMLNTDHIKDLADALEDAGDLTPVDVFYDGRSYWLADGFHRWSAYHRAKRDFIPATIHEGDLRAAILYSITANAKHAALKLTRDEKRAGVARLLKDEEWRQWSDREIARRAGVDHKTVGSIRKELSVQLDSDEGENLTGKITSEPSAPESVTGEFPSERTYTTKHGTTAKMRTSNIGKSQDELSEYLQPRPEPGYKLPSLPDTDDKDEMLDELVSNEPEGDTDLEPYRPPYPIPSAGDVRVKPDDPLKRRPFMRAFTAAGALSNLSDDEIVAGLLSPENQTPQKDALGLELSVVVEKINRCMARAEIERTTLTVQS